MKKILVLIIVITTLTNCSDSDNNSPSELKIRLSNISKLDFQNIVINTSTEDINFENISTGQNTEYKVFDLAYRYAFVELEIDGVTFTIQPIDYVGETPLEKGRYTYQIDANGSQERFEKLSLTLVID